MDIGYIAIVLGVILVSMMLHELMHGFIALKLGDDTAKMLGRLSFNPLKHVDPFMTVGLPLLIVISNMLTGASMPIFGGAKPVPFNPANIRNEWGVALVAAAGPLVNLVLAFVCYGVWVAVGMPTAGLGGVILNAAVWVNLGFFAFNMLPIPPLDGSRLLYAIAPESVQKIMRAMENMGIVVVFGIVLIANSLVGNILGTIIDFILKLFVAVLSI